MFGQDDCVFSEASISDEFLKESEVINSYSWDSEKNMGQAILKNGGTLNINKWACHHYGLSASMLLPKEPNFIRDWENYVCELSKLVNSKLAHKMLLSKLEEIDEGDSFLNSEGKYEINLSGEIFPEYYVNIYELEESFVVSIYHYRN